MSYNFVAGYFDTKKIFVADFLAAKCDFTAKRPFCVLSPFCGERATYNVYLRLEVDFLLVLIELFC